MATAEKGVTIIPKVIIRPGINPLEYHMNAKGRSGMKAAFYILKK
jgi:hypothetical protein